MFFDTHVHLNSEQYENIEEIIKNAIENGVEKMVVVGYDLKSSLKAVEIARNFDFIYAAIGIHPSEVKYAKKGDLERLEEMLLENKVVAIGEIGLDYHWDKDNKGEQETFFVHQLKWSKQYDLPVIIHSREAGLDTYEILKKNKTYYTKGVMHCYSYSLEMAKDFITLGFYLSFGGALTFLNAKQNKEVVDNIDLKNILIETDCPYLTPHPYRGERNEPMYIKFVVKEIARIKNVGEDDVAQVTYDNACELFEVRK